MSEPSDLSLRQLRCLCAVAEMGSFRRAAERLGITQPSLSAQIQGLETALGRTMVERSHAGALLTPEGREVERRARDILDRVGALSDAVRNRSSGTFRLGVTPTVGPYLLPSVVARLHETDPDLKLYIREAATRALAIELAEGRHDAVVTQLPLNSPDLASEDLFRERLLLIVARDHPLASKPEIEREDLKGLEVLSIDRNFQLHDQVAALCESFGARFQRNYEGTSLDALRLMTGLGMGVTFLPALYVRSEIRVGSEVVSREISGRSIYRTIGLAYRRSSGRSPVTERLAEALRETYRSLCG